MCKLNKNNTTRQLTTAVYFISPDLGFFFLISQLPFIVCFPEAHQITLQNTQKVKKKKKWQHQQTPELGLKENPKNSRIRSEGEHFLKSGLRGLPWWSSG